MQEKSICEGRTVRMLETEPGKKGFISEVPGVNSEQDVPMTNLRGERMVRNEPGNERGAIDPLHGPESFHRPYLVA